MKINNLNEARALIKQARLDKRHLGITSPFPKEVKEALVSYALDDTCHHSVNKISMYCGLKNVLPKWVNEVKDSSKDVEKKAEPCNLLSKLNTERQLLVEKLNLIKQCEALKLKIVNA